VLVPDHERPVALVDDDDRRVLDLTRGRGQGQDRTGRTRRRQRADLQDRLLEAGLVHPGHGGVTGPMERHRRQERLVGRVADLRDRPEHPV